MESMLEEWFRIWLPIVGVMLTIATILVSIVYMIGSMLMNERMKGWAKLGLFEIFYSAVIVILALAGLGVVDSTVKGAFFGLGPGPQVYVPELNRNESLCLSGTAIVDPMGDSPESPYYNVRACHIRLGIWYLHTIFKETSDLAFKTYLTYIYTSMAADFTINFELLTETAGFVTFNPWRGFFTMGNTIKSQVFDYAIKLMLLNKFQEIMLAFIAKAAFPALFVVGVILRTFSFTRRLGGLLLGMALALYYIFPLFYAFGGLVVLDLKDQVRNDPEFNSFCSKISEDACNDPPITNLIYINGSIPMPGGGGSLNTSQAMKDLDRLESMNSSERMREMEKPDSDSRPLKEYDFSNRQITQDEQLKGMEQARNKTQDWFDKVSSQSMFDTGVFRAFRPGGPVDALSRVAFFSVFFSLFGILATIAAIRSLSVTFGGDIEIAGLTHLI